METMSRSGSGLPTSLSGSGLVHMSHEVGMCSPVKRRSGLFPRLLSVDSQTDRQRGVLMEQRSLDHHTLEETPEQATNHSSPEVGLRHRSVVKKDRRISRSTSSSCSFSTSSEDHLNQGAVEGGSPIICRSPTELKSKNSPRSHLRFRFERLSHSATGH